MSENKTILYKELIRLAKERKTVTYRELAKSVGMHTAKLIPLLIEIARREHEQGKPMLTAVVVGKDGIPGDRFFELAEEFGLFQYTEDKNLPRTFWEQQIEAVCDCWKTTDITRRKTNARMSQIVVHGDTVYLAGQVAKDRYANITKQTEQVLEKIDGLLAEAGTHKSRMLSAQIWLTNIRHFDDMNAVWDAWVPEGCAPARACTEARLAHPDLLVEIGVIAAK